MTVNYRYPNQRIKAIPVSVRIIANMLRVGHLETGFTTIEGVPMDAELLDFWIEPFRHNDIYILFSHPSFEPVPQYARIPTMDSVHRSR